MKGLSISKRERRMLAGGVVVIGGVLASAHGIPAWLSWKREASADAAKVIADASEARERVLGLETVLDSLEQRKARFGALAPLFVAVGSPTAAAGTLASLVSGASQIAGVEVGALHVLTDTAAARSVKRVSVRAELAGDIRGITALLLALERGPALLAVRELSITQPEPGAGDDRPERLQVQLLVEGLVFDGAAGGNR